MRKLPLNRPSAAAAAAAAEGSPQTDGERRERAAALPQPAEEDAHGGPEASKNCVLLRWG